MAAQIGVIGLATMGQNLARNIASKGFRVSVYNRSRARTDELMAEHGQEGDFTPTFSLEELVGSLERPRAVLLMVKAGAPVDEQIDALVPLLEPGDLVIDGGNSHFVDTRRRAGALESRGLQFLGTGISGGEEGALHGPSIMPGGHREAYERVEPIFTAIAAKVDGTPCCAYIGPDGAGHFVKMVHNGIEYADIQLIAETYDVLRQGLGLSASDLASIFQRWNEGSLQSYLVEITAAVLAKRDAHSEVALVDVIVDEAEQKGTGRWTSQSALELGVPLTAITEAVFARSLSGRREARQRAASILHGPDATHSHLNGATAIVDDAQGALYASKIVAYAQGFEHLAAGSAEYSWDLDLGMLATIWRGGCIIRAQFLDRIRETYAEHGNAENLMVTPYFAAALNDAQGAWRRVVRTATDMGVPAPAFSSSLAYYDGYRRGRGPANLIQGLRDYFGAHTYRRLDREGSFHTRWGQDGDEVRA
jgi:6-phosphogluconate dehydrogenase